MNPPRLVHEILDARAASDPDGMALSDPHRQIRYGELAAASRRIVGWLRSRGVGRGDRVVILAPPGIGVVATVYACARMGAIYVVVHDHLPQAVLVHILADAEPALLITADDVVAAITRDHGVALAMLADVECRVDADEAPDIDAVDMHATPLTVDPVSLIYTSGSTGMPKAVVSTHAQVVFAATVIVGELGYRDTDVIYGALPLSFDYGLYQIYLAALAGAHLVLGPPAAAGPLLLRHLRECGATVLPAVPVLVAGLARMLRRPGAVAPPLRLLTNTGAAMPPEVLAQLRAAMGEMRVQLMFGLTECKRATIMPPDEDLRRPGACGRALPGTEVYTIDSDGRRLPAGEVGEIVVRGPNVMAGYWRRPDLTAIRFPRVEGLFPQVNTGDYGWLDEDGYLYFVGRRDDIYKERGVRVSATEVEMAALRVPGVREALLLVPGPELPDATLVVVTDLSPQQVLSGLVSELEDLKIPRRCVACEALPVNGNGKLDRHAAAALITKGNHV